MTEAAPASGQHEGQRRAQSWRRARAEVRAALAVLDSAFADPAAARIHVLRGIEALAAVADGDPRRDLPQRLHEARELGLDAAARERLVASHAALRREEDPPGDDHDHDHDHDHDDGHDDGHGEDDAALAADSARDGGARLRRDVRTLGEAVSAVGRTLQLDPEARRVGRRVLRTTVLALLVLVPAATVAVLTMPDYRDGPWAGRYYATPDMRGEPMVRRDGDIRFDWAEESPIDGLPRDGFSIRWDTCMELATDHEIIFQLVSDDGSRLLLDGEKVVDNWGRHGSRSVGETVPVAAGLHHLRVDYFDEKAGAMVILVASMAGERPEALPVRILHYPGESFDEDDPCADVRVRLGTPEPR